MELATDLQIWWDGHRLLVSAKYEDEPTLHEKVTGLLLTVFRFKKFTDSRWCTLGDSSRTLVASLSLGLDALIELIRKDPRTSNA